MKNLVSAAPRFAFIDALRGVAALWVALYHFTTAFKAVPAGYHAMPNLRDLFEAVAWKGYLGVDIFFVLSGFVIAYSLRSTPVTPRTVSQFVARRSLRLDPPYLTALFLALACGIISHVLLSDSSAFVPARWGEILANMVYLQELLRFQPIVVVAWTLCIEVQFYLVFMLLWGLARAGQRRFDRAGRGAGLPLLVPLLPLALYSLLVHFQVTPLPVHGLFVEHWYLFQLGVLACWATMGRIKGVFFVLYALAVAAFLPLEWDGRTVTGLVTAGSIFAAGKVNYLHDGLAYRPLQYLGRISYSLYLLHPIIGNRILNVMMRLTRQSPSFATTLVFGALALAVSLLAAELLYCCVERPSVNFAKRLKRQPVPHGRPVPVQRAAA